jgi:tetratricopeptide (TPR) repeat protein
MAGRTKAEKPGSRSAGHLLGQAQDLIYQAWEIHNLKRQIAFAKKALALSPDCADAYVLLAEATAPLDEALELYRKGVEASERALGERAFVEDAGHFWGILETRPYMRARAGLAQCLWASKRRDEALEHYRDMLRLNPNDNQGVRYILVACLLELGRDDEVAVLLEVYPEDVAATWPWTGALLSFRKQGDNSDLRAKLAAALETNTQVPAFLLGKKTLPSALPDLVGFGDESEAICYAAENLEAWQATNGALSWLAATINAEKILH